VTGVGERQHRKLPQVNVKLRATIDVAAQADQAATLSAARAHEKVQIHLEGKTLRREVVIPGKLVNFVARIMQMTSKIEGAALFAFQVLSFVFLPFGSLCLTRLFLWLSLLAPPTFRSIFSG
jgi:hypothetical protein